jgi:hypothetical protein
MFSSTNFDTAARRAIADTRTPRIQHPQRRRNHSLGLFGKRRES